MMAADRAGRRYGSIGEGQRAEIVRRAQAGEFSHAIADSMGLPRTSVNAICRKVRDILGMPTMREQISQEAQARGREVLRRSYAGDTDQQIADALGSTATAIGKVRIAAAGTSKYRKIVLTDAEKQEIDRLVLAAESTRAIARIIGCSQKSVNDRAKLIRHLIPADISPCECGRPRNHGGRCRLSAAHQAEIRARILKGDKVDHIARDLGYSGQNIRVFYARPIIAELRAAGHPCPCGKEIGHRGLCLGEGASPASLTAQATLRDLVEPLLRQGLTRNAIAVRLGVSGDRVTRAAAPILAEWAADGVLCGCGQPISHKGICSTRSGLSKGRGSRSHQARYKREARELSWYDRGRARALLTKGRSNAHVAELIGCREGPIKAVVRALEKSGVVLPDCKCGLARNHSGSCAAKPKAVAAKPKKKSPSANLPTKVRDQLVSLYKAGTSNSRMSELTGLSLWKVGSVIAHWKNGTRYKLPPCACGRPARHSGGCSAYMPNAIDKRALAMMERMVRDGIPPVEIAGVMGSSLATVCRHTRQLRERLVHEGVACGCGRPIGHRYWCSSKWDVYEMPVGRRPRPTDADATVALMRGDRVADIGGALGVPETSLWRLLATLPQEQRQQRRSGIAARMRREHALRSGRVRELVNAAVPRRIDGPLRDDIVGELQLAIIEGRVEIEQIGAVVRSFISRGFTQWQSAYGPASIDAPLSRDSTRTLADIAGDITSSSMIDDIEIGQPPP